MCTLFRDILLTFFGMVFVHFLRTFCSDFVFWLCHPGLLRSPCYFTEEISTFCSDFVWYSLYILRTLHALLINIMCALFVYISLPFYAVIFYHILRRFNRHFMFSMSQNCCFQRVFTDNIFRF